MATPIELSVRGELRKIDPQLDPQTQEERLIYASGGLIEWLDQTLPSLASNWQIETPPMEQLDAFLEEYASGEPLVYKLRFNPINPIGDGIWELKTADLRIFGWFHKKDCFIGVSADMTWRIKEYKLYAGYRNEAVNIRNNMDIDEPKFIPGDDPNDVVSNYTFT